MIFRVHVTGSIETAIAADSKEDAEVQINARLEAIYPQWDCCVVVEESK